jgi:RNA polymerase sigma-70 factor (ECF subfamily)
MENRKTELYHKLYLQYAPLMHRFAEKFVSAFYAEDIVHDVFLKLWNKEIYLLSEEELKKMLFVSVRNNCIDHLRRIIVENEFIDTRIVQLRIDELDYYKSSEELFIQEEKISRLKKSIEELPERSREIFKMTYLKDMKASEIAEKLNISVRTVENLIYRSMLQLRKKNLIFLLITMLRLFI